MPTIDSNGLRIDYEVAGDGPAIALVHGFASNREQNWKAAGWFGSLVSAGRRVVALDCRGHGRSDKPHDPEAYAEDRMADDVIAVVGHSGVRKPALMGYSMGGKLALNLLVRHQQRFSCAIIAGIGAQALGVDGPRDSAAIARALLADDPSEIEDPIARGFRAFAAGRENDVVALACCMRRERAPLSPAQLRGVELPVLLVVGEKDDLAGSADRLAAAIPGAVLEVLPGRDHLSAVADPRFKEIALSFLDDQQPAPEW